MKALTRELDAASRGPGRAVLVTGDADVGKSRDSPVLRALAELPPQFRTAVYLADVEGYQQSDIADIMGTPIGTVASRIRRGRATLRSNWARP